MDLDPSMQRILEGASSQHLQNRHSPKFGVHGVENLPTRGFTASGKQQQNRGINTYFGETHSNAFSFAPGPRHSIEQPLLLDGIG